MAPKTEQPMFGHGGQNFRSEEQFLAYLRVFLGVNTGLGAAAFEGKSCSELMEEADMQGLMEFEQWPSLRQLERAKGNKGNKGNKGKGKGPKGKGPY